MAVSSLCCPWWNLSINTTEDEEQGIVSQKQNASQQGIISEQPVTNCSSYGCCGTSSDNDQSDRGNATNGDWVADQNEFALDRIDNTSPLMNPWSSNVMQSTDQHSDNWTADQNTTSPLINASSSNVRVEEMQSTDQHSDQCYHSESTDLLTRENTTCDVVGELQGQSTKINEERGKVPTQCDHFSPQTTSGSQQIAVKSDDIKSCNAASNSLIQFNDVDSDVGANTVKSPDSVLSNGLSFSTAVDVTNPHSLDIGIDNHIQQPPTVDELSVDRNLWKYIEANHKQDLEDICGKRTNFEYLCDAEMLRIESVSKQNVFEVSNLVVSLVQRASADMSNERQSSGTTTSASIINRRTDHSSGAESSIDSSSKLDQCPPSVGDALQFTSSSGISVRVYCQNLLSENVDAIVCSVDCSLRLGTGGVAGAVAMAAGSKMLQTSCDDYIRKNGRMKVSHVMYCEAGQLRPSIKYVILAAGPSVKISGEENQQLAAVTETFFNCFRCANDELKVCSISVPAISSGLFGVSKGIVAKAANDALARFDRHVHNQTDKKHYLKDIRFVNIDLESTRAFVNVFSKPRDTIRNQKIDDVSSQSMTSVEVSLISRNSAMNVKVCCSNLLSETVDAVVCSVNANLDLGGGAAGAVATAAGSQAIRRECADIVAKQGPLGVSQVTHVSAGNLRPSIKYVILVVGPTKHRFPQQNELMSALSETFYNCLQYADDVLNISSVSIPAISAGNLGVPSQLVALAAVEAVVRFDNTQSSRNIKQVRFVNIDKETSDVFVDSFHKKLIVSAETPSAWRTDDDRAVTPARRNRQLVRTIDSKRAAADVQQQTFDKETEAKKLKYADSNDVIPAQSQAAAVTLTDDEDCVICLSSMTNPKKLDCGHVFCCECIKQYFDKCQPKCPSCGQLYGVMKGNQPPGTMSQTIDYQHLAGYEMCSTIRIDYDIPNGVQTDNHPNPGVPFHGTHRTCYLPNNDEGQQVCELLRQAFDAGLIFTVGRSITTGAENMVIWNDIHHKTNFTGPYGYPDPSYLSRVKTELAAKGIQANTVG